MTTVSEPVLDEVVQNKPPVKTPDRAEEVPVADASETPKINEREMKIAYAKAVQQRKDAIKKNKELIADAELEVAYLKAEADKLRYRFEAMDFYVKLVDIEPKYLQVVEAQKAQYEARLAEKSTEPILS